MNFFVQSEPKEKDPIPEFLPDSKRLKIFDGGKAIQIPRFHSLLFHFALIFLATIAAYPHS